MRAAITGIGLVGHWGHEYADFINLLKEPKELNKPAFIPELDFFSIVGTKNKRTKKMERLSRIVSIAAKGAMNDASLEKGAVAAGRGAVVTGSSFGALDSILTFHRQLETDGPSSVNPNVFPPTSHNVAGGHLSIEFGFSGPLIHFASGSLSAEQAILYASDLIETGRADVIITGGWDILCNDLISDFSLPESIDCKPLSPNSKGMLPAEGAAILVIESEEHAQNRGAKVRAYLEGGSIWTNEHFANSKEALAQLALTARDCDLLCSAANGLPEKDEREVSWLRKLFLSDESEAPTIMASRSFIGETFGAGGAFDVATAIALFEEPKQGFIVPSPSVPGAGYFAPGKEEYSRALLSNLTQDDEASLLVISHPTAV